MNESLDLEVSPTEVSRRLALADPLFLVDVREPEEYELTRIEGSDLVPMNTVPGRLNDITERSAQGTVVLICHHGIRSLRVAEWLRAHGVENCQSMFGGIERWSIDVDRNVPRY